mgnify:CR=1 FL=1
MKFEELLEELNKIVKELESGNLSLEDSIEKYKKGIDLANQCKAKLTAAKEVIVTKMAEEEKGN